MQRDTLTFSLIALVAMLVLTSGGCASVALHPTSWQWPWLTSEAEPPGTPAWWKKHKKEAEFVPQKGFHVAGVDGFFDQEGRPIKTHVAKVINQKKHKGLLKDVKVASTVTEIKSQMGLGPDQKLAEQVFAAGEDAFRHQKYKAAAKQFKKAIARWPDSKLEQDALFQLAESQFFATRYPDAVNTYDKLIQKYPNTRHLNKVIRRQFDIARYWDQYHQYKPHWSIRPNLFDKTRPMFDTLGRAFKTYENIRLNDPTGPLADDAIMATANSYFLQGRYNDADYQYELLRNEYPHSEHQYEAHVLGLQCKLRKYQGPDYDDTPLREGKKLVKQLKVQFSGELDADQRKRLTDIQAQLNMQLAARDYKMAKFYDDTKQYGSAKFYYAQLMREYPETELASKSRDRYLALGGKPDHPPTKMQWLVDVFPQNAERQAIAQVPMIGSPSETRTASHVEPDAGQADEKTILR